MKYLLNCLALVFFFSCSVQSGESPSVSDEKLARIMADLNIAEAATNGLTGFPKDSLTRVYYAQVFEIHGISQEVYEKDLRIVSADLPRLQRLVLDSDELLEKSAAKQIQ